jgi:ribosome modulation factor
VNIEIAQSQGYTARQNNFPQTACRYSSPAYLHAWNVGWKEADEFMKRGDFMNMMDKTSLLNRNNPVMKAFRR